MLDVKAFGESFVYRCAMFRLLVEDNTIKYLWKVEQ
jgi:hypothetical protein